MTGSMLHRRLAVAALTAALGATIAFACADSGPELSWSPESSSAILSPANDTRSNLVLLLADRDGTSVADPQKMQEGIVPIEFPWRVMANRLSPPPPATADRAFTWEEPDTSRCHSSKPGSAAFAAAVGAESQVPAAEKAVLVQARDELKQRCAEAAATALKLDSIASPAGEAFAAYLSAARLFYAGEFDRATSAFHGMGKISQPWVRETALYMVARSALNQAQMSSLDEYGDLASPEKRDLAAIDAAGRAFGQYLTVYPGGRYAGSARGLLRRVAWLKADQRALAAFYSELLNAPVASGRIPNVAAIEEIDRRLLPSKDGAGVTDPVLLAVIDLMRLRPTPEYDEERRCCGARLERAELEAQRPLFKSNLALFDYLRAVDAMYGREQPREVLALIPDAARQQRFSYVQFSRQMLRGFALEAVKDPSARGFWLSLLPGATQPYQRGAVELALVEHDRSAKRIDPLFAAGSPLRHPLLRHKLLEEDAGVALLRQQSKSAQSTHEREVALYLLLAGELHHGLYADFLTDMKMVGARPVPKDGEYQGDWSTEYYDPAYGEGFGPPPLHVFAADGSRDAALCPDLRATAANLAASPDAIRPRLCLAEFIRRNGFDGWNERFDSGKFVARSRNGFPGKPLERIEIYRAVIASSSASPDDRAFALNRAIRCFAPARYSSCGGNELGVEQRRAWFTRLKRDFPRSPWATSLKYYW